MVPLQLRILSEKHLDPSVKLFSLSLDLEDSFEKPDTLHSYVRRVVACQYTDFRRGEEEANQYADVIVLLQQFSLVSVHLTIEIRN